MAEVVQGMDDRDLKSHIAFKCATAGFTQTLADSTLDENLMRSIGEGLLINAALQGHIEIMKTLLVKGADVTAIDRNGYTALMRADDRGHTDIVKFLSDTAAQISLQAASTRPALFSDPTKASISTQEQPKPK